MFKFAAGAAIGVAVGSALTFGKMIQNEEISHATAKAMADWASAKLDAGEARLRTWAYTEATVQGDVVDPK